MLGNTKIRLPLLLLLTLSFMLPLAVAQRPEMLEGWEEFAEESPFPTSLVAVPSWRFARGPHVRAAFREVVAEPSKATVRVRADGKKVAYGAIVRADGWIVTKASQLSGEITCLLADKRRFEARIAAASREYDVALLKIEATDLPVLKFAEGEEPLVGAWLATVGIDRDPVAVGVMSVEPREIAHRSGILGIYLGDRVRPATVFEVFPKTGAIRAGVLPGDVIISINGKPTPTRKDLVRAVQEYSPEDKISVEIRRNDETIMLEAVLTGERLDRPPSREEFQNHLGGDLSRRRFGFPDAFQHDTVLKPEDCGGPLVNLDSEVVGINLARAGRTETYAISVATLNNLIEELLESDQVQ